MNREYRPNDRPRTLSLEDMIRRAEARPPFRVPGLIHSALTGISGEPFVGKSSLATHLVISGMTASPFLGVPWDTLPDRVLMALTDPGAVEEYGERFSAAGLTAGALRTHEGPVANGGWASVREDPDFGLTERSLVCYRHPHRLPPRPEQCGRRACLLRRAQRRTVRLRRVGRGPHAPEREARKGRLPFTCADGDNVHLSPHPPPVTLTRHSSGGVRITTTGNQATEQLDVVAIQGDHAADWRVQSSGVLQRRSKQTMDRNAEIAAWVTAECQGLTKKASAARVSAKFGGTDGSWERQLQPSRALGKLVSLQGSQWVLTP